MATPSQKSRVKLASASKKLRLGFKSPFQSTLPADDTKKEDMHEQIERLHKKDQLLREEIAMLQADGCREEELQDHIDKLHQYNEIKDVAQMVMGRIDGLRKVMYEDLEKTKNANEKAIMKLRDEITSLQKIKRREAKLYENAFVITLKDKKLAKTYCKNTPEFAKEEMEEKLFLMRKQFDALCHHRHHRAKELSQMTTKQMEELTAAQITLDPPAKEALVELENKIQAVKIKTQEAYYVNERYELIRKKLVDDQLHYERQIKHIEEEMLVRKKEKKDLRALNKVATSACDKAIADIAKFKSLLKDVHLHYRADSDSMLQKRKNTGAVITNVLKRKSLPYSARMWAEVMTQLTDPARLASEERELAAFVKFFDIIKDKTGIATAEEFSKLHKTQDETGAFLKSQEKALRDQVVKLRANVKELQKDMQELKYRESQKSADSEQLLKSQEVISTDQYKRAEESTANCKAINNSTARICSSVDDLAEKLKVVNGASEMPSPPKDAMYIKAVLKFSLERLLTLQQQQKEQNNNFTMSVNEPTDENPPKDITLGLFDVQPVAPDLERLGAPHDKFLTRNIIKQMTRNIVDNQAKAKKRLTFGSEKSKARKFKQ